MSRQMTTTAATIAPTILFRSRFLLHDERGRAPDIHYLDARARLDHALLVKRSRSPYLVVDAYPPHTLVVGDPLEHNGALAHQGRATGPQRRPAHQPALNQRPDREKRDDRRHHEHDPGR